MKVYRHQPAPACRGSRRDGPPIMPNSLTWTALGACPYRSSWLKGATHKTSTSADVLHSDNPRGRLERPQ
jgi:hypothetical protein